MSDWHANWHAVDSVLAFSRSAGAAFDVLLAIAALGNKNDGDWTFASRDRIAMVARRDRRTVLTAVAELVTIEELEYDPGRPSSSGQHAVKARYRVRTEVLRAGHIDTFRSRLTGDARPPVTDGVAPPVGDGVGPPVTGGEIASDRWSGVLSTGGEIASPSINRVLTELEQISVNTAREENARVNDASKDAGVEQREDHPVALKTALEECQRAAHSSAGGKDSERGRTAQRDS